MAVFGIEYRPQFVQSDIGAMQKRFDDLQRGYDESYAGALAAEDMYNSFETDVSDIGLKNEIIGGFKDRVQSIVDKHGGDWGAASKQLAREVIKTKQDPFFQLAATKRSRAEEERLRRQALGPNAIVQKSVRDVQLRDSEGNYIDPSQLESEVLDRSQFKKLVSDELGYLKSRVKEGEFRVAGRTPWLLERDITTGISESEVNEVARQAYDLIKRSRPDLNDDTAMEIAIEEARSYVGNTKLDFTGNQMWEKPVAPQMPNPIQGTTQSYFEITDEAKQSANIESKFIDENGRLRSKIFGENLEKNPLAEYDRIKKEREEKTPSLSSMYSGERTGRSPEGMDEYNVINRSDYDYLKKVGVESSDDAETVIRKLSEYREKQAIRYSKYRVDMTDYSYIGSLLSSQIPDGAKISGTTGILQPLDQNMKPKGGTINRNKFNNAFLDEKGNFNINNMEFVPSVGLVITTVDGQQFKVGKGGVKDQLNEITDPNSYTRRLIDSLIERGSYTEANNLIYGLIGQSMPMLTNAQVAPNPVTIKN
jgi:hypothetical protein